MFLTDAGSLRQFPAFWMRSPISALILAVLLSSSAFAQTVVPITSEPDHHLVISNDYVRVFQVEVPPKTETLYHQHDYDYLYVVIGDADVTSTRLNEKPTVVKLNDGDVELAKGPFTHKATNNSDQRFRNVTIELLRGIGNVFCTGHELDCGLFTMTGGGYEGRVVRTDRFTAERVLLRGKTGTGQIHGPFLVVGLSVLNLTAISQNSTQEVSLKGGDALWIDRPGTRLQNSAGSAKFILISFSPAKTQ